MKKIVLVALLVMSTMTSSFAAGSNLYTGADGIAMGRSFRFQDEINTKLLALQSGLAQFNVGEFNALLSLESDADKDTLLGMMTAEKGHESYNGVLDAKGAADNVKKIYNIVVAIRAALVTFLTNNGEFYKETYGINEFSKTAQDPISLFLSHIRSNSDGYFKRYKACLKLLNDALSGDIEPLGAEEEFGHDVPHDCSSTGGSTGMHDDYDVESGRSRKKIARKDNSGSRFYTRMGVSTVVVGAALAGTALVVNNASNGEQIKLTDESTVALWSMATLVGGYVLTLGCDAAVAVGSGVKKMAQGLGCGRKSRVKVKKK